MNAYYKTLTDLEGVPDPFAKPQTQSALASAVALRKRGLSYPAISEAIDLYHGIKLSPDAWSVRCRANGIPKAGRAGSFESSR